MAARPGKQKNIGIQVVTANRLGDGRVVYLAPEGVWVERIDDAATAADATAAEALMAQAAPAVDACQVVEPYLIEVEVVPGGLKAKSYRELIRASGPSMWTVPGKQAAAGA